MYGIVKIRKRKQVHPAHIREKLFVTDHASGEGESCPVIEFREVEDSQRSNNGLPRSQEENGVQITLEQEEKPNVKIDADTEELEIVEEIPNEVSDLAKRLPKRTRRVPRPNGAQSAQENVLPSTPPKKSVLDNMLGDDDDDFDIIKRDRFDHQSSPVAGQAEASCPCDSCSCKALILGSSPGSELGGRVQDVDGGKYITQHSYSMIPPGILEDDKNLNSPFVVGEVLRKYGRNASKMLESIEEKHETRLPLSGEEKNYVIEASEQCLLAIGRLSKSPGGSFMSKIIQNVADYFPQHRHEFWKTVINKSFTEVRKNQLL